MTLEPKVFAPHAFLPGQTPRKVMVERKRREFHGFDINEDMGRRQVIQQMSKISADSVFSLALHLFDDEEFEYRPLTSWLFFLSRSLNGLKARVMREATDEANKLTWVWDTCWVTGYNESTSEFTVKFADCTKSLHRLYICFDTEDPANYCDRFNQAIQLRAIARNVFALQVYVDCMPVDFLRPLDSEQVTRVLEKAMNKEIREDTALDPSIVVEQFNLNHMRTINQLILTHKLKSSAKDIALVNPLTKDTHLFESLLKNKPNHRIPEYTNEAYKGVSDAVRFNSLWNKVETIKIMFEVQIEDLAVERLHLFNVPENKTVRVEDFSSAQSAAATTATSFIKDSWVVIVQNIVINNLKDVKKGWFSIVECNLDVYSLSKLKRFLSRLNFMMEDSLRIMLTTSVRSYCSTIKAFCPSSVTVLSNNVVEVKSSRNPLFTVDLKFVEASATGGEAAFIYTTKREAFMDAILNPVLRTFDALKSINKLERRVMKHLFWPSDPQIRVPYIEEPWVSC